MTTSGSYKISAEHDVREKEVRRLRAQALLSWSKEARTLAWFGLRDGMSILELGSGPGFITEQLLDSFPNSQMTALEIDPVLVARAQQYLKDKANGRLRFVQASIMDTGLSDAQFDFALARLIFQHLPDPIGAAREVCRVLKPGGKLAIIDVDDEIFGIVDPPMPILPVVLRKYAQAQAARGGNRHVGRRLWRILKTAGFQNLDSEAVIIHSGDLGIEPFLPQINPDRLLLLLKAGMITEQELQAFRAAHRQFLDSAEPFVLLVMLLACGEKF